MEKFSAENPRVSLIAALAENRCIGMHNKLPWYLPEDLKYFKAVTSGKPILMGRTTFESLGKPLPNRTNIVITRNADYVVPEGVKVCPSLESAIALAKSVAYVNAIDELLIIGGAQIYALALPLIDRMYLTEVKKSVEGDAFFPLYEKQQWQESSRQSFFYEPAQLAYDFVIYDRKK